VKCLKMRSKYDREYIAIQTFCFLLFGRKGYNGGQALQTKRSIGAKVQVLKFRVEMQNKGRIYGTLSDFVLCGGKAGSQVDSCVSDSAAATSNPPTALPQKCAKLT